MSIQTLNKYKHIVKVFLGVSEWALFLGLCIISALLMKDVLQKFMGNKSSFSIEMQRIAVQPTLTICFDGCLSMYEYETDFKIMYNMDGNNTKELQVNENTNFHFGEIIHLQKLANAYKITSENYIHRKGQVRNVMIWFANGVQDLQYLKLSIFITSEANAYGVSTTNWMDGEFLEFNPRLAESIKVSLTSKEFHYLKQKSNCSEKSFYEVWGQIYLDQIKENCNTTCSPISLPIPNVNLCNHTEWQCPQSLKYQSFSNYIKSEDYFGPCTKLQYKGKQDGFMNIQNQYSSIFSYKFASPELTTVHEEYFIYDTTGMIGSVGGSLGMCIGFSFSNIFNWLIYKIRNNINN